MLCQEKRAVRPRLWFAIVRFSHRATVTAMAWPAIVAATGILTARERQVFTRRIAANNEMSATE